MKLNQKGFSHPILLLLIIVVIGTVSFAAWRVSSKKQVHNNTPDTEQIKPIAVLPDELSGIKPLDEVLSFVKSELGSRQITAIELEQEDQGLVYAIKLSDGVILLFDAKTGVKLQTGSENNSEIDGDKPLPADFVPKITIQAAVKIAKEKRSGKTVSKVELEVEDGVVIISVRFTDKGRIDLDALTGEVLRIREPGKNDVMLRDSNNDIDNDGKNNGSDSDDDNDGTADNEDSDRDGDGVSNRSDSDDDNDGVKDSNDKDSTGISGSSNSGSDSGSHSGSDDSSGDSHDD